MAILVSETRAQRASVATTLPAEVARGLSVTPGQKLAWIEDGMGGFRVVPHPLPETGEALAVRARHRVVFGHDFLVHSCAEGASPRCERGLKKGLPKHLPELLSGGCEVLAEAG